MPTPVARIRLHSDPTLPIPSLPDGVYLNLDERPYFDQDRLGSTDISRLYLRKEGWWWSSKQNPENKQVRVPAMDFGKALHKAILEGVQAFNEAIFVAPDKETLRAKHGDKFCITTKDMLNALEARGMHPKASESKEWFAKYCSQRAPDLVIWDTVQAKATEEAQGKILLTAAERRDIELMASIVHNHGDIGELFQFGPDHRPMPEVTILWTDEHGLRRRARIDELLPNSIIDLKSIANIGNRKLAFYAGEHVGEMAYHVQMADHMIARRWMYRFILDGRVFDGTYEDQRTAASNERFADQLAWLKRFPTEAPNWDYAWIFYQKPDAKAGQAPVVFPWGEDLGGDLHRRGIRCRREAIATYRRCMEQFGATAPWVRVEPLHTSAEDPRVPNRVFIPHWIGGNDPLPDEDDDL